MGPYYITALVNLLGPVKAVAGFSSKAQTERMITSEPLNGTIMPVDVDTYHSASMLFENGAIANMVMSFDVWQHSLPKLEIYGTEGTLFVPDPNTFGGPVKISRRGNKAEDIELIGEEGMRGAGLADIVVSLREGRQHRANDELAFHVLDIMESITHAGPTGAVIQIGSTCQRPAPLPAGLADGEMGRWGSVVM